MVGWWGWGLSCGTETAAGPNRGDASVLIDGAPNPSTGPCAPPLALVPPRLQAVPGQLRTIRAEGGTGRYRFELVAAPSGGAVNPRTGAYVAGPTPNTTDELHLTDEGCQGDARGEIEVEPAFRVTPGSIDLRPGEAFQFGVEGGSGGAEFRLVSSASGGTIDAEGRYLAGSTPGRDVVEAFDGALGIADQALVQVSDTPRFEVQPGWVGFSVGGSFELEVSGGSGRLVVDPSSAVSVLGDRTLRSSQAGRHVITVRDAFLERSARIVVEVREPLAYQAVRAGQGGRSSRMEGSWDLDGDGFGELVFGHPEADVGAAGGGAVFVFAGGSGGFEPEPRWSWSGQRRGDRAGEGLALGDIDRDGVADLLVGAPFEDRNGRVDSGAVRWFRGDGSSFEPTASWEVAGRDGDRLGSSLAVCDFNGDGRLDVAVGRPRGTDRRRAEVRFGQGAVSIYLGRDDGLPGAPDQERFGDLPTERGWEGQSFMAFGAALSAGDVDGDGRCDLAVGAPEYDRPGSSNDGLVALFRGVPRQGNDLGGVSVRPARLWAELDEADRGSGFGTDVVLSDLDGDNRADVVVGQPGRDIGPSDRHGAVRVFVDPDLSGEAATIEPASEADATVTTERGFSELGTRVVVSRFDEDARPDLIVGAPQLEADGVPGNAGGVLIFRGRPEGVISSEPDFVFWGEGAGDQVGAAVAVVEDLDGDDLQDVVAHAGRQSTEGVELGALLAFSSGSDEVQSWVWPGAPAGLEFGSGAALVGDVTGNDRIDVVVGGPRIADPTLGRDAGRFWLYEGREGGLDPAPTQTYVGFPLHSGFDRLGHAIDGATDFDGDDRPDVVVVSRLEDQPGPETFGDPFIVSSTCAGSRNNVGAAFVFRGRTGGRTPFITPDFIFFGPEDNAGIETVAADFDGDGDGRSDLALGSTGRRSPGGPRTGGVSIVLGRDRGIGRTRVECGVDEEAFGADEGDGFGASLAGLGDLDGDGCDELAVGAPAADPGLRDAGTVSVRWGTGPGCGSEPAWSVLGGGSDFGNFGSAVAGGEDFDGDGTPDLVVGAPRAESTERFGSVTLVPGAALSELPRGPLESVSRVPVDEVAGTRRAFSSSVDGRFGQAVAVGRSGGRAWIAVGAPRGDVGGQVLFGGVELFELRQGSLQRFGAIAAGARAGGEFGEVLRARGDQLLAGSRFDSAIFLDGGAIYHFGIDDAVGR